MGFFKQTINTVPLEGETILLRADYNVPLAPDSSILDDFRIRASIPTLKNLLKRHCKVVIISHLGRPKGRDETLSLAPVAKRLAEYLAQPVEFIDHTIGDKPRMRIKRAPKNSVILLENLRFYSGEEANDPEFARELVKSSGARYFVQDGFGVVHRSHASTDAITMLLPSVAGSLLEHEYTEITHAMKAPRRPLVAVLGGAKVADKIEVIEALIDVADRIVLGGAMANTFLFYKGHSMGKSRYESDVHSVIDAIYAKARQKVGERVDEFLVLPTDLAVGYHFDANEARRTVSIDSVGDDDIALDIGDQSIEIATGLATEGKTVIWNGTLGMAEFPEFAHGSARMALALATHSDVTSIIGGGDTADFVLNWDSKKGGSFSHVSTGGGASLELMAGKKLPGIESLLDA